MFGSKRDAVFALVVDLDLRVVGSHMALAAVLGMSRLRHRELVTAVARRARTATAVGVETTDAGVGPSRGVEPTFFEDFDLAAVTLPTTVDRRCRDAVGKTRGNLSSLAAFDDFSEHVVERT